MMNISEISFYPLYQLLLNVTDETRRRLKVGSNAILIYSPCKLSIDNMISADKIDFSLKIDQIDRVERTETIHDFIHDILSPLVNMQYKAFGFVHNSFHFLHFHAVFASYSKNIPVTKDFLAVKYGNVTNRLCYRCFMPA